MRTLSGWTICGAALVGAAGPARAAGVTQAHVHAHRVGFVAPYPPFITRMATYVLEPGEGGGAGAYHSVVSATLHRTPPPPKGEPDQGGFLGTLYAIDIDGGLVPAAQIAGKWVREVDGTGSFGADLLVPSSETRDHPLVAVGSIAGALRAAVPSRGASGTDGLRARSAITARRMSASWIVQH